jgi:hypothetical protein
MLAKRGSDENSRVVVRPGSAVRAGGAWPRPHFYYHFSRKAKLQINPFPAEPWPKLPAHPRRDGLPPRLPPEQ